ncbi:MAG: NPCBM/NEW2 domain-containing protein, partial [Thermoguttaceae bacterium]|nr:NPCBM/NEW2 domain-containing protein [Thermoguttaceae bacterium]
MKIFQPLAFAFLLTVSFAMAEEKTVYLDEMDLSKTTCGWKSTAANRTVDGAEPAICGRKFEHCVGHHAPGEILISLPDQCGISFTGVMGIDDETNGQGHAEYEIYCDWKLVWKSGELVGQKPAKNFSINLKGVS